jgi:predicted amidohydrolase YtcJ
MPDHLTNPSHDHPPASLIRELEEVNEADNPLGAVPSARFTIIKAKAIITLAGSNTQAMAVFGDKVIALGTADHLKHQFPNAALIDFGASVVIPGFNDAHMHPSQLVSKLLHVDLSPENLHSSEQLTACLASRVSRVPTDQWIVGYRYDHTKTTNGRILDRWDLDAISDEQPILIMHIAGHWAVANSRALELAHLNDDTVARPGGEFGRDPAGHLDGRVYESAMIDAFFSRGKRLATIPPDSIEDRLRALSEATKLLHSAGLTSVCDAMALPDDITLFQEAERQGRLDIRINALLCHEYFDHMQSTGMQSGIGSNKFRIAGVKATADGAIAGGTCLIETPYEGTSYHGLQVLSDKELRDIARMVSDAGSRLCVHANGDRAIAKVLSALEDVTPSDANTRGSAQMPPRIEHCTMVNDDILNRIRQLKLTCVPFGSYIAFHGEKLVPYYGEQRLSRMFTHRWFLDSGIPIAGSSDHCAGPFEPLLALQSCVTRETADGRVLGECQRISAVEALWMYTVGSAKACGEGAVKGRLAPGYLADFTVLAENPLTVDPHRLGTIPVLSTWVGGERVWPTKSTRHVTGL